MRVTEEMYKALKEAARRVLRARETERKTLATKIVTEDAHGDNAECSEEARTKHHLAQQELAKSLSALQDIIEEQS